MRGSLGAVSAFASFALLIGASGCGELDIVDHDELLEFPDGNFPSEALERCGPLPKGVESIVGLRTAWAMEAIPFKDRDATYRVATTSMVLRLSDEGMSCDDELTPELLTCPSAWAVDITLRRAEPDPGRYLLDDYGQGFSLASVWRDRGVCEGEMSEGDFDVGELEIFAITDECVVGRLVDTADALADAGAPIEGGFVAMRCPGS